MSARLQDWAAGWPAAIDSEQALHNEAARAGRGPKGACPAMPLDPGLTCFGRGSAERKGSDQILGAKRRILGRN